MNPEITLLITSFNRRDLLKQTTESLATKIGIIENVIIIEDSGDKDMHLWLRKHFGSCTLILNETNIGAYESIDFAYSVIKTPYVLHCEDDWQFYRGGFIEPSLKILESNPSIMQVNLSNEENMPIEPEVFKAGDAEYRIMGTDINGWWHGYSNRPNIRSMEGYQKTKPWARFKHEDLSIHECQVGLEYYRLGYKAAVLNDYFCTHIGLNRCTWHS